MEWPEKCLIVSALTLSLLDYFDQDKLILLTEFIETHETQVYQRALIGFVVARLMEGLKKVEDLYKTLST